MESNSIIEFVRGLWSPREKITKGLAVCDTNHGQVHAGNAMSVSDRFTALGTSGVRNYLIKVPAGAYVHLQSIVGTLTRYGVIEFREGTTVSADGTAISVTNRHRIKDTPSVVQVFHSPTITANGTLIKTLQIGSAGLPGRAGTGASDGDGIEWVLKPATNYLVRVANWDTEDMDGVVSLDWYEEEGA